MKKTMNKSQITRLNILNSARDLFVKNGYINTDIGDIAKCVDIDRRTIYRYFESKEALAFAVWMDVLSEIMNIGQNCTGKNGFEKLSDMFDQYVSKAIKRQDIIKFLGEFDHMFSGEYPNVHEAEDFISYIKKSDNWVNIYLNEGIKDKSIRSDIDAALTSSTISNMLLSICQRVIIRQDHLMQEQGYAIETLYQAVEIILKGIKA